MKTQLSVNLNKVATLRNTRTNGIPSVVASARRCLEAGAHGVTIHPRPDERHIRASDVVELAAVWRDFPNTEFNIEGNPFEGLYLEHISKVRPTQCTLVPDDPSAWTSDHGWNLRQYGDRLRPIITKLHDFGSRVSLFMDAGDPDIELAAQIGADRIELYTEPYAVAFLDRNQIEASLNLFAETARLAQMVGLGVNAGHDLNLENLPIFLRRVPNVLEVSIGHALIGDALEWGMSETVKRYLKAVQI